MVKTAFNFYFPHACDHQTIAIEIARPYVTLFLWINSVKC